MTTLLGGYTQGVQLQATLSAASAASSTTVAKPHHPITCTGELAYEEDGTFRCEHASVEPHELRTQHCINHSIALLLIEAAKEMFG